MSAPSQSTTAIIGGGISGLLTSYLLKQKGKPDITLFESSPKLGGRLLLEQEQDIVSQIHFLHNTKGSILNELTETSQIKFEQKIC